MGQQFCTLTQKSLKRGAFHKAGFSTETQKEYEQYCSYSFSILSGGNEPPFTQGSLGFVRPESPSSFPDKHCFCGHKKHTVKIF